MNISISFRLSKKDILAYMLENLLLRWPRFLLLAFGLFAGLLLFQLGLSGNDFSRVEWTLVFLPIPAIFLSVTFLALFNVFVVNNGNVAFLTSLDASYTFRDSGVEMYNPLSEGFVKYDAWVKHVLTPHYLLLYQDAHRANIIPLSVLTDEQRKELSAFFRNKKWKQDAK